MNKWRWEVYMLDVPNQTVHTFTSTRQFPSIEVAHADLMWHIESGILEKDYPLDIYNLIDVVYHLEIT